VEPYEWVSYFQELFSVNNDRMLEGLYETRTLGTSHIAELESDSTNTEVKELILKMKNNKATGRDGIPAEFQKIFFIRRDGIETSTNKLNKIKNGKGRPLDWKIAIICAILRGRETERNQETTEESRFYRNAVSWLVD
jgi:hypothetical protein